MKNPERGNLGMGKSVMVYKCNGFNFLHPLPLERDYELA